MAQPRSCHSVSPTSGHQGQKQERGCLLSWCQKLQRLASPPRSRPLRVLPALVLGLLRCGEGVMRWKLLVSFLGATPPPPRLAVDYLGHTPVPSARLHGVS